jgi:cytoskeletal protein CcmA (bactofilin family)
MEERLYGGMADEQQNTGSGTTDGESLEGAVTDQPTTAPAPGADDKDKGDKKKKKGAGLFGRFSVYLLMFAFVILIALMVVVGTYLRSHTKATNKIKSQDLTQSDLNQLAQSDVTVGDAKQVLNVQSNAVFAGQVLVRSDLQVAGKLQVGGSLSLTGITVSGDSVFDQIQVNKNLQVAGDTAVQGGLTVAKSLNVNGGGTFNGPLAAPSITVNTLQLNGDIIFTHHITAGGVNPGRTNGNALGGGGTASVGGSDTSGSITINTGGNPSAGCFITVNFASKFNSTPHVVVSPIEAAAGNLAYYVTRTSTSFSVCSNNAPAANASFGFDYIVFN